MTNTRFEDLEKRVKSIKIKKYIKIFVIVFILLGLGYYITCNNQPKRVNKPLHVKKIVKVIEPKITPKVQKFEPIKQIQPIEKKEVVVKKELQYDTLKLSPTVDLPYKTQLEEEPKVEIQIEEVELKKKSKITFRVKEVKSEEALLERFRTASDFESAMGLANLYFEKQNFEKSIHWSRKASKLTSGDESAWLIYAKSKHALNKTDDAIKALQLYLEYFSSQKIEKLLKLYRNKK